MSKNRFISAAVSVLVVIWVIHFATNYPGRSQGIKGHTVMATDGPSTLVRALRPSYPYSVIAGGAYSPSELAYAHSKDNVVRAHYADFDLQHAHMVTLTDDRHVYVSYRLKDQVFWTKKRLLIPRGELLLTDGPNYARARCGNRLSDVPHETASSAHEPDPAVLSLPPITPAMLPQMALANPPALGAIPTVAVAPALSPSGAGLPLSPVASLLPSVQPAAPGAPVFSSFAPVSPGGLPVVTAAGTPLLPANPGSPATPVSPATTPVTISGPPTEVAPVPEPSTIWLFLLSLAISVWALLRMTPKDKSEQ